MSILAHTTFVRRNRRKARRDTRTVANNIKRAAARKGHTNMLSLSRATGISLERVAIMWFGSNMNIVELTTYMMHLELTTSELFAGTGDAA